MSTAIRKILYASEQYRIGAFRCPPDHAEFEDSGPTTAHLIVFPRLPVQISYTGRDPVLADPTTVMLYNRGQAYRRGALTEQGDRCDWLAFAPALLSEAIACYDPAAAEQEQQIFTFTHGPSDPRSYLSQRLLVERLLAGLQLDPLRVEEVMLTILRQVLASAYQARGVQPRREHGGQGSAELASAAWELLGSSFCSQLTLDELARAVYCSPYHLCRVFRRHTGTTIHQHLTQLRLRAALEQLLESEISLTALSAELGFASHSHFTQAFRAAFGLTPSEVRRSAGGQRNKMSKILIAERGRQGYPQS
jgi:AraC family transcriptional regulator